MPRTKKPRGDEITITEVGFSVEETQEAHHTDEFESVKHLVVRRGAELKFQVTFSRPLSGDHLELELHRGFRTSYRRGTRFTAELGTKPQHPHQLEIKELESDGAKVKFSVSLPADFPVGSYRVVMEIAAENSRVRSNWEYERELVVLFNPWCPEDGVYLVEEDKRQEYVMNESGLIWAGTADDMFTWPWNFAQFETTSLEAVLYLLDLYSGIDSDGRRSPAQVARALTEMVNKNDSDGGILFGLWSPNDDDYKDGTDPTAWSGSSAILEEFMASKRPVKYGQCWVFGGTLTAVLRTVGIPARPVTNFESAHDADANRAIDYYYDKNDDMMEDKSGDSIWNYHVWVEAWMSRPDLGPSYGGWQAIDATPQELSPYSQSFVVGPASIAAIKDGQNLKYDNEFVISEVNADIKYHYEIEGGKFELAGSNTTQVGVSISTKAVGRSAREDVTDCYKYPEGSIAERAALGAGDETRVEDVKFTLTSLGRASIGEDFSVLIRASSEGKEKRTVRLRAMVHSVTYTGVASHEVKRASHKLQLEGGTPAEYTLSVSASDYLGVLGDQALLSITAIAFVEETKQSWVGKLPYRVQGPSLTITIDGKRVEKEQAPLELEGGTSYPVTAQFTNPLPKSLSNVQFFIEGAGLTPSQKIPGKGTPSGKVAEVSFQITPKKPHKALQERTLVVTCQSKELKGTMGTAVVIVK